MNHERRNVTTTALATTNDTANQMFQSGDLLLALEITTEAATPKTHAASIVARMKAMAARSIADAIYGMRVVLSHPAVAAEISAEADGVRASDYDLSHSPLRLRSWPIEHPCRSPSSGGCDALFTQVNNRRCEILRDSVHYVEHVLECLIAHLPLLHSVVLDHEVVPASRGRPSRFQHLNELCGLRMRADVAVERRQSCTVTRPLFGWDSLISQ
jgi:hypothetical protein